MLSDTETTLLNDILKLHDDIDSLHATILDNFNLTVDSAVDAYISYDDLIKIDNDFKEKSEAYDTQAKAVEDMILDLQEKYSKYGTINTQDFSAGKTAFTNLCGDDETVGYLEECRQKLVQFDTETQILIEEADLDSRIDDLNQRMTSFIIETHPEYHLESYVDDIDEFESKYKEEKAKTILCKNASLWTVNDAYLVCEWYETAVKNEDQDSISRLYDILLINECQGKNIEDNGEVKYCEGKNYDLYASYLDPAKTSIMFLVASAKGKGDKEAYTSLLQMSQNSMVLAVETGKTPPSFSITTKKVNAGISVRLNVLQESGIKEFNEAIIFNKEGLTLQEKKELLKEDEEEASEEMSMLEHKQKEYDDCVASAFETIESSDLYTIQSLVKTDTYKAYKEAITGYKIHSEYENAGSTFTRVYCKIMACQGEQVGDYLKEKSAEIIDNQTEDSFVYNSVKVLFDATASIQSLAENGDISKVQEYSLENYKGFANGFCKYGADLISGVAEMPELTIEVADGVNEGLDNISQYVSTHNISDYPADFSNWLNDKKSVIKNIEHVASEKIASMEVKDYYEALGYISAFGLTFLVGGGSEGKAVSKVDDVADVGRALEEERTLAEINEAEKVVEESGKVAELADEARVIEEIGEAGKIAESGKIAGEAELAAEETGKLAEVADEARAIEEVGEAAVVQPKGIENNLNKGGSGTKPKQLHHFATNKNKTYTPQFEKIANKYGLDLDDAWNKEYMLHQGRHPNEYHEYVLDNMIEFDRIAQGDKNIFLKLYKKMKLHITDNPDMLYKDYWKNGEH